MFSLWSRIRECRESNNLSQEQLAEMLLVSRPTLVQIEADNRKVKAEELKKLSNIFDTTVDFLLSGENKTGDITISEDQKTKFKHLIIYILSKVWAKYNVGKVVFYKLLYFSEFDYYEMYHKHISGYPFIKLPMWPAPLNFNQLVIEMEDAKEITTVVAEYYNHYYQQRFVANIPIKEDRFSKQEQQYIDEVLERYSDYWANEISEKSHEDKPWQISKDMDIISYDTVKFREFPYSPLARINKKQETQQFAKVSRFFDDLADNEPSYEEYR